MRTVSLGLEVARREAASTPAEVMRKCLRFMGYVLFGKNTVLDISIAIKRRPWVPLRARPALVRHARFMTRC
jgi:hypothetical protein